MGELNLGSDDKSRLPDLAGKERFGSELTGTYSELESTIMVDSSKDFTPPHHCFNAKSVLSTEWTNEKHNLYLDALEADFVTELHHSRRLRGWLSEKNLCRRSSNSYSSSHQFMVQRDVCWQKTNCRRDEPLLDSTADSLMDSPRVHKSSAGKRNNLVAPTRREDCRPCTEGRNLVGDLITSCGAARNSERVNDSLPSSTEVSDQNFVDSKQRAMSRGSSMSKRLKKTADSSSNDQVVPFGKFHKTSSSTLNHASSEREQQQPDLLSEHPESFVSPKTDLHYFLRGS